MRHGSRNGGIGELDAVFGDLQLAKGKGARARGAVVRDGAGALPINAGENDFAISAVKGKKKGSLNFEADEWHDDGETSTRNFATCKWYGFEQRRTECRCVGLMLGGKDSVRSFGQRGREERGGGSPTARSI